MQHLISNTIRRSFGASLAAVLLAASAGLSAPSASVDTQKPVRLCPGTSCPQTSTCYTTKGAFGAGCIQAPKTKAVSAVAVGSVTPAANSMGCRPVKLRNFKGALSVEGGQKLIHCGQGKAAKATLCAPSMPCANGAECTSPMTCAV